MDRNGVWQLTRLVFRYCPMGGSSRGMREFLRSAQAELPQEGKCHVSYRTLRHLAESNPQIEIVAKVKKYAHPMVTGEYLINEKERRIFDASNFKHLQPDKESIKPHRICVKNQSPKDIYEVAMNLRNSTGRRQNIKLNKPKYTEVDSIQGYWEPFITQQRTFTIRKI